METGLFRPQAINAASEKLGRPGASFGVPSWLVVGFLAVAFICAIVFLCLAKYAKKETAVGLIVPAEGVARIAPAKAALVKRIFLSSGEPVSAGQTIFALSYDSVLENGTPLADQINQATAVQRLSAERQAHVKKQQIAQSRLEVAARIAGLQADEIQMKAQAGLHAERTKLLEQTLASSKSLHAQHFITALNLRQREDELIQARLSLLQINQNISRVQSQVVELNAQLSRFEYMRQEADASLQLNRAQLEEKHLGTLSMQASKMVAPRSGRLTAVQVREGDLVAAGQTLALVVPESKSSRQQVHLWVPSRAIGFIERGLAVRLMFDAFPYQTFGVGRGTVIEVASAPLMPDEIPMPTTTREQMYRIVVALERDALTAYGREWPLSPGMRLSADLVLVEKSLLDWLLEPVAAARKRADA